MRERSYLAEITAESLPRWAHISDDQVRRDIADTEAEIAQYERTMAAEEEIARSHPSDGERQMAEFKAMARPHQIAERRRFVEFLNRLLAARGREAARA